MYWNRIRFAIRNSSNLMRKHLFVLMSILIMASSCRSNGEHTETEGDVVKDTMLQAVVTIEESDEYDTTGISGFVNLADVVPDVILEIRYFSTYNFVGRRIDGYLQPTALLSRRAADSLKAVSNDLAKQGYRLKIFDAYRPQMAVDHFARWGKTLDDTLMRQYFYPRVNKRYLFSLGYISHHSGHSRGSTVDLTLFDMAKGKEVDMGGTFDWFGSESHTSCGGDAATGTYRKNDTITYEQFQNRMILRRAMVRHGFRPYENEWWHFTLRGEPYPNTYFKFPVREI